MDRAENKGLLISSGGALLVGCVGILFSTLTASQAILLDGAFNLVYFVVSLMTIRVARLVYRGDDVRFPVGYSFYEPLINGVKGVLILGITVMALFDAFSALFAGGRNIAPGIATLYGAFATIVCSSVALLLKRQVRQSSSPLLKADADSWIVNAAISSAVLITFIIITLMNRTSLRTIVPYVDPMLVILVCSISVTVPVKLAWRALLGLINRAPPKPVLDEVEQCVLNALAGLEKSSVVVRVLQPGRVRLVGIHIVLPQHLDIRVEELDLHRRQVSRELEKLHALTVMDMLFTKDPVWGAPFGGTTETAADP